MSMKIDFEKKKRLTRAEAQYLFDRPWLTSKAQRDQLRKMLSPEPVAEDDSDSTDEDENDKE